MSFLDDAFIYVLNMSMTASVAALVVVIARILLKRAPKVFSYALWSIVFFRLVCPFSFSSSLSLFRLTESAQDNVLQTQLISQDLSKVVTPILDRGSEFLNDALIKNLPVPAPLATLKPMQALSILALVWSIGIAAFLLYALISYIRLKKRISTATLVSDNIYETDLIKSPFVCGFVRPKIYLPLGLEESEREYILCHEQTHIKRFDHLIKPIAYLALILHWFNPFVWLCFSLMIKDMEMSCDERVMRLTTGKEITGYSSSLLSMAMQKKMPGPSPLAFGESNVKARIKNILHYRKPEFWVIIASVITVVILATALMSNPVSGYSIDGHPEHLISDNSLKTPAKIVITDLVSGKEYMFADIKEIGEITAIVRDMRISRKEINKIRGGKTDSRFTITYYDDFDDSTEDFRYTFHIAPVWIDNDVKPTLRFKLINEDIILKRIESVISNKISKVPYDIDYLLDNKTQYIGNHVKVGSLLNGMPLPEGITRVSMQLSTEEPPYGVTYHYELKDDSIVVSEEQFLRNSILLFALIDNADEITHLGHWNNKLLSSTPFKFTYTRADIELIFNGDVRQFAESKEKLAELIEMVDLIRFDIVE